MAAPQPNTWHEQRRLWNNQGRCAREACQAPLPQAHENYNKGSDLLYCDDCAAAINKFQPKMVVRLVYDSEKPCEAGLIAACQRTPTAECDCCGLHLCRHHIKHRIGGVL